MIKFSSNSWHFKLANLGERRVWESDTLDICRYIRYVTSGLFFLTMVVVFSSIAIGLVAFALYENYKWIMGEQLGPVGFIFDTALVLVAIMFGVTIAKIEYNRWRWIGRYSKKQNDGFVTAVYQKFKQKTCFKVTIGD